MEMNYVNIDVEDVVKAAEYCWCSVIFVLLSLAFPALIF
jgi:hypothetical protein